jgi:hypothetical protein
MVKAKERSGDSGKKSLKRKAAAEELREAAVTRDAATESGVQPPKAAALPPSFSISEIKNKQRRHLMFTRWKQQQRKVSAGRKRRGACAVPPPPPCRVVECNAWAIDWSARVMWWLQLPGPFVLFHRHLPGRQGEGSLPCQLVPQVLGSKESRKLCSPYWKLPAMPRKHKAPSPVLLSLPNFSSNCICSVQPVLGGEHKLNCGEV